MSKEIGIIRANTEELSNHLGLHVGFEEMYSIMKAQCFGGKDPSHAQMSAFVVLANQYKLNPLTKEIYAFPSGGGITPIVGIDGWLKIAHSNPNFNGITHELIMDDKGGVVAVKCIVARKDFAFHTETIEFMSENRRNSPTWKQFPVRMLKHRATAQAIRMAFNVNAMMEDEYHGMNDKQSLSDELDEKRADISLSLESHAENGIEALTNAFNALSTKDKQVLGSKEYSRLKEIAESVEVIDVES